MYVKLLKIFLRNSVLHQNEQFNLQFNKILYNNVIGFENVKIKY